MFDFNTVGLVSSSFSLQDSFEDYDDDENTEVHYRLEDQIEYVARVSNPSSQNGEHSKPGKLTSYLMANDHWSPLEMVNVCLEINTTRDIARQILRHRSFSFQEFSQRYADASELADSFVIKEARSQDSKNRQNSNDDMSAMDKEWWNNVQKSVADHVWQQYTAALERGVAKECARSILPEGMTPSRLYMNGTVRSWVHYIKLRTANGTQLEHQDVANKALVILHDLMPNVFSSKNIRGE